jgi:hypothetical protein
MAQDVVGRGDVKKELRNAETEPQRLAGEFSLRAVPEREQKFFFGSVIDPLSRQAPQKIDRGRDSRLEFGNVRFGIWKYPRLRARQQGAADHGVPNGLADLACEIIHVGIESRGEQNRRIDVAGLGMGEDAD